LKPLGRLVRRAALPSEARRDDFARKLNRAVRAVRRALRVEREEAIEQRLEASLKHGAGGRPDSLVSGGRPYLNEEAIPRSRTRHQEPAPLPSRPAFYKYLNRELAKGERRKVGLNGVARSRKARG